VGVDVRRGESGCADAGYAGRVNKLVDEPELKSQNGRGPTVVCALAGLTLGYLGWLVAVSIGEAVTTVSQWGFAVLVVSVVVTVVAALWARRLSHRGSRPLAAFALTLPVLPVALTLGVLTYTYL
jgi:hypothetical protein